MRTLVTSMLLVLALHASARSDSLSMAPRWNARLQFAGMQGLFSAGVQWNVPDGRLQLGALYGFAPAAHGGPAFHGAVVRATGAWCSIHRPGWSFGPIASLSAVHELGEITFFALPPEFPKGYYKPQALHGTLGLGLRVGHRGVSDTWAFTVEAVALDTHLWYGIIQHQVEVHRLWNMALGVEYYFGKR